MSKKVQQQNKSEMQMLTDALVDLYLSVKIRSNEEVIISYINVVAIQIDNYSEEMLGKERKRLKDVGAFTILDYIKTSIEILMNMKMEENGGEGSGSGISEEQKLRKLAKKKESGIISDTESMKSLDEPPKDYEQMLVKYEAEVRNHIKIEQQLKLHIECIQDKLDDSDKQKDAFKRQKKREEEDYVKELQRYKDLLGLREKESENLKHELKKIQKQNEDLRRSCEQLESQVRALGAEIKRGGSLLNI